MINKIHKKTVYPIVTKQFPCSFAISSSSFLLNLGQLPSPFIGFDLTFHDLTLVVRNSDESSFVSTKCSFHFINVFYLAYFSYLERFLVILRSICMSLVARTPHLLVSGWISPLSCIFFYSNIFVPFYLVIYFSCIFEAIALYSLMVCLKLSKQCIISYMTSAVSNLHRPNANA